jgi:hypothetical protein
MVTISVMLKLDKRKLLGPLFSPLSKAKHSRASRILVAMAWLPSQIVRARSNRPYFAVNIASPKGMGAVLSEALLMCHYAKQNGLVPRITSTNPLYASDAGEDFISTYLGMAHENVVPGLHPMHYRTRWSFYHLDFAWHLSLPEASTLFWTYFPPKQIITDRVEAILANVSGRKFDLSIHYRGTDKALEAPLVNFEVFKKAIFDYKASGCNLNAIFLATDDPDFEAFVRQILPDTSIATYNLGSPIDATRGRHFSDMSPEDKAIESLVNMFLLAAAPTCIRCASYMSAISKIINPELRTVTLNRTHWGSNGFPECEILADEGLMQE